jgi:preprotein translocase subunit SecE
MAENTVDNKSKRRGRRLKPVEAELEVDVEEEEDDDSEAEAVNTRGITAGKGRPTPGRRNTKEVETASSAPSGNVVTRPISGLREYFEGVSSELRKVSWPTREDVRNLTIIVLATTIVASLTLGVIGVGFTELFRLGLLNPVIFLVFFIVVGVIGFFLYRRSQNQNTTPY